MATGIKPTKLCVYLFIIFYFKLEITIVKLPSLTKKTTFINKLKCFIRLAPGINPIELKLLDIRRISLLIRVWEYLKKIQWKKADKKGRKEIFYKSIA